MPPLRPPHRPRGRRRFLGLALAAAVALGACGGDDDDAATTTTTEATTTTTEATTTTTAPPTDEDLVAEAVLGYETFHEQLGNPVNPDAPHVRELLTGPMLDRSLDILRNHAVSGTHYEGRFDIDVGTVSVDGDTAVAETCAHDLITRYRADRSVEAPPEDAAVRTEFRMQRTDERWRIAEIITYEEDPCSID